MPALDTDIAAASRDVVKVTWADPAIAARYPAARDGSLAPADGYFDSASDAQTVINARGALIGTERRRFTVIAADIVWPASIPGVPQAQLVDSEQDVNGVFFAARIEIDLEAEATTWEEFG